MKSFKQFSKEINSSGDDPHVIVILPLDVLENLESKICNEGRYTKKVGKHKVHKDSPHFSGGEYHGHVDMPGGKQVSYTMSGNRLHPNKFPSQVPQGVKNAIANVLGISSDLLESYKAYDEIKSTTVYLLELKQTKAGKLLSLLEKTYSQKMSI